VYDKTVRRRRAVLLLLVVSSLILLTAYFGESAGGGLHSVQRGVFEVVSPIQDVASRALKPFRDLFGWVGDTFDAKGQNQALRKERDQLRQQLVDADSMRRQNRQFRDQLDLGVNAGLNAMGPVEARVTGTSPSLFAQTLTVSRGSADGVQPGQPVVGADGSGAGAGLVGKVSDTVGPHFSRVTLLTDNSFAAGARISATGVPGYVQPAVGSPRDLVMQGTGRARVDPGQTVVTSGTDPNVRRVPSLYPPDIPIGKVTRIDDQATDTQLVHVRPFVDVRRVEYVQILTKRIADNT
jgi:rod shape-determining protein MreC